MSKTNKKLTDPTKILKKADDYCPKGSIKYDKHQTKLARINRDPEKVLKKTQELIDDGRIEIHTKDQLESFPLGSAVSYVTIEGLYRSGGFLKSIQDKYFTLQGGSYEKPISFPVQFKNVNVMYVKNFKEVEAKEESDEEESPKPKKKKVKHEERQQSPVRRNSEKSLHSFSEHFIEKLKGTPEINSKTREIITELLMDLLIEHKGE